jgi:hypothetical protein
MQFSVEVGGQGATGGQLDGNDAGGGRGQALGFVQGGQLGQFGFGGGSEFAFLLGYLRALTVTLAGDRHVLTQRHRYGPATSPASPAVKMGPRAEVTPAIPMTMPGTETIPSLASQHRSLQPVQPARDAASMRLPGMRWLPFRSRLDLSVRGHVVISTHALH